MTNFWKPRQNPGHLVNWDTQEVIIGNKTFKQLITDSIEDPIREWKNPAGIDLPDAALKGIATSLKARWELTDLTIKGQSAD